MLEKKDIEFFGRKEVTIFLKNKFVHNGVIEHVGNSTLVIDDIYKGLKTIKFSDIDEIQEKENGRE